MGKINLTLIEYILFENSMIKTAVNRKLISQFSAL
jgi:hypothetical protein